MTLEPGTRLGSYVVDALIWDIAAAEKEFRRAIELESPASPIPHFWYGTCLAAAGRLDEAIAEAKRGQALDPLSAINNAGVAWMYHFARRDADAIEHARESLELDPDVDPLRLDPRLATVVRRVNLIR
jgi:tetratricopeptide (TPR) repeat protein